MDSPAPPFNLAAAHANLGAARTPAGQMRPWRAALAA
jgi:hypothetical protein